MRLGDILRTAGSARPITLRPVSYIAIGENEYMAQVKATVPAVLMFVNEQEREQVRVDLHADLAKRFPGKELAETVVRDEEIFHLLVRALRDADADENGFHKPLAANVTELRCSLVLTEAKRLSGEYAQFMLEEFPEKIDDETWAKLVEDAKKNSLPDLLTAYGYGSVVQVLSSLAGRSSR